MYIRRFSTLILATGLTTSAFAQPIVVNEDLKLTASDGENRDRYGASVDVSGDLVVVGAIDDVNRGTAGGSVYVVRADTGLELAKILPQGLDYMDGFGGSVSIDGNTIVASAEGDDDLGSFAGAAYVYTGSGGTWSLQQKLTAADGVANDRFGFPLELLGDTIIVSARFENSKAGACYVFTRTNGVWAQSHKLTASDGLAGDEFGSSLAFDGRWLVVGAERADRSAGVDSGVAYIFEYSRGVWAEVAKIVPSDGAAGDGFGFDVDVAGDVIVVGAPFDTTERGLPSDNRPTSVEPTGSAYVFELNAFGQWLQARKLVPDDGIATDRFGNAVALNGQTVYVGSFNNDETAQDAGAVYSYQHTTGIELDRYLASDGSEGDQLGVVLSVTDEYLVVGQPFDEIRRPMFGEPGAAYVFFMPAPSVADFNDDGVVDFTDFKVFNAAFLSVLGEPEYNPAADFNGDGAVDNDDFQILAQEFNRVESPS